MENQDLLAAEADVDTELRAADSTPKPHQSEGVRSRKVGERVSERYSDHEDSPLLGDESDIPPSRSGRQNGVHENASAWPGMNDFEGLPWWKKPSVRIPRWFFRLRKLTCA